MALFTVYTMKFDFHLTTLVIILAAYCNLGCAAEKGLLVSCAEVEEVSGQYTTYLEIDVGNYSSGNSLKVNMNGFNLAHSIGQWGDSSIEIRMWFVPKYDAYFRIRPYNTPEHETAFVQFYCNATPNAVIGLNVIKNGILNQPFHEYKIEKFSGRQRFNLNLELSGKDILIKREQSSWEVLGRYNYVNMDEIYKVEVQTRGPIQVNELCAREIIPSGQPDIIESKYTRQSIPKYNNPWENFISPPRGKARE